MKRIYYERQWQGDVIVEAWSPSVAGDPLVRIVKLVSKGNPPTWVLEDITDHEAQRKAIQMFDATVAEMQEGAA